VIFIDFKAGFGRNMLRKLANSLFFGGDVSSCVQKVIPSRQKRKGFLLYCSRLFVTLASPKFLALGNAKEKQVFLLHFTRYFVTLPRNVKT